MKTLTKIIDINAKDNRQPLKYGDEVNGYSITKVIGKGGS